MRVGRVGFQPIARAFRRGRVPQARILAQPGEEFIEHLRMNWGHYLNSYIKTWKQQVKSDDEQ